MARFRSQRAATTALSQQDFLRDLLRGGGNLFMSSVGGKTPTAATSLPKDGDEDERCWWRGYPRIIDGDPVVLWSLLWPRPEEADIPLDLLMGL